MSPEPAPSGSEKLGHPSRVKDKGLMKWYAKSQRFCTKCSIVVFGDIFQLSYYRYRNISPFFHFDFVSFRLFLSSSF